MSKRKYADLVFVSSGRDKYLEYRTILGIPDLQWSNIKVTESQLMNIEVLVEEKIKRIRPQLPRDPFFVEHTGLSIDAWKGMPGGLIGVFMDTVGNEGICKMMRAYRGDERTARARVVIGYSAPEGGQYTFQGEVIGQIAQQPRGSLNFGWDAIFIPAGETRTYAEMPLEEKNKTSMRKMAVDNFARYLDQYFEL